MIPKNLFNVQEETLIFKPKGKSTGTGIGIEKEIEKELEENEVYHKKKCNCKK